MIRRKVTKGNGNKKVTFHCGFLLRCAPARRVWISDCPPSPKGYGGGADCRAAAERGGFTTRKKVQFDAVLVPGAYEACATKKVFPVQWCLMVTDGVRTEAMTSEQCPMNQRMTNGGLRPAILLQPLQTLAILEVRGATN